MSALMLATNGGTTAILVLVYIAVAVLEIAALWQVFVKAGQPGWAAIIPIWQPLRPCSKVIGRPCWWILLFSCSASSRSSAGSLVFVIGVIIAIDLAKSFAKSTGFAVGLIFLNFIFDARFGLRGIPLRRSSRGEPRGDLTRSEPGALAGPSSRLPVRVRWNRCCARHADPFRPGRAQGN